MKQRRAIVLVGAVAILGALTGAERVRSEAAPLERVGVEVRIAAVDREQGTYECTAVISNLASEQVLSAPRMIFRAGDTAEARSGSEPGIDVHITASVNEQQTEASYTARVYRAGDLVSSQNVVVVLAGS